MTDLPDPLPIEQWTDEHLQAQIRLAATTYDAGRLVALFTAHHAHLKPKTLKAYSDAVHPYIAWARERGIALLTPRLRDDEAYLHQLTSQRSLRRANRAIAAATIRQHVAAIRGLYMTFRWANTTSHVFLNAVRLPSDPTPGIEKNPPYSQQEVEALLKSSQPAERALVLACGHAGLRVGEALGLTPQHLSADPRFLTITGKRGRIRTVPLSARTREAFTLLPPQSSRIFPWTYRQANVRLIRLCQTVHVRWRGFHALRKYAATRLYHQTLDYTRVAAFLGHSSTDTTRRYVAMYPNDVASEVEEW